MTLTPVCDVRATVMQGRAVALGRGNARGTLVEIYSSRAAAHERARLWAGMSCRTYERQVKAANIVVTVFVVVATPALVRKGYAP